MVCWVALIAWRGKLFAGTDLGQAAAFLVLRVLVLLVGVGGEEAVEADDRTDGAKLGGAGAVDRLDLDGGALDLGRLHLAGDGALPDQLVEPRLVGIEILPDRCRRAHEIGRADRLVRFLGVLGLGRVEARLLRQVSGAEFLGDGVARGVDRLRRHLHAVGSHIGDQAGGLAADVHAFIEALRHLHGARWPRSRGRDEASCCSVEVVKGGPGLRLVGLASTDSALKVGAFEHRLDASACALLAMSSFCSFLPLEGGQPGLEVLVARRAEDGGDLPVFLADEALDLGFAVADQAQRHRLDAAGRAGAGQLAPQHRRQREADEIVERPAGEIGIDQRRVDLARIGHRFQHRRTW